MSISSVWLVVLLLFLGGCASVSAGPPPDLASAPIGAPPRDYESRVRAYFDAHLRDPASAIYALQRPVRGWEDGKAFWAVCGTVNARNAYGVYAGPRPLVAFFVGDDQVRGMIDRYAAEGRRSPLVEQCHAWHALGLYM